MHLPLCLYALALIFSFISFFEPSMDLQTWLRERFFVSGPVGQFRHKGERLIGGSGGGNEAPAESLGRPAVLGSERT